MTKIKLGAKIVCLLWVTFCASCKYDCENVSCFTPPTPFQFELEDKTSGENVFTNGTYNSDDIKVIDLEDQSSVAFSFIDEDDYNILQINTVGWKTETVTYSIQIATQPIFELYVDAERKSGDCCSSTTYREVRIDKAEFETTNDPSFFKIILN